MANIKISQLTAATSASGTQEFEVNDSGTSKKVTGSQIKTYVKDGLVVSDITDLTATATELNYVDGVTSAIQTQVDAKAPLDSPTFTGAASFPDGTAAAPSITNTGDTNTGIFFPAADTIAFAEGGVESMRIDSSGNAGIGLTSPTERLHVSGNILATGNVTAYSDARLKTNVRTVPDALGLVQQMRGVFFDKDGEPSVGVIAQEMEQVLPEVVTDGDYKSVAYGNIVGVLIEAIKAQQAQIDELKAKLGA
jgi:hypothetical protein